MFLRDMLLMDFLHRIKHGQSLPPVAAYIEPALLT
jgi:hypothetical protein